MLIMTCGIANKSLRNAYLKLSIAEILFGIPTRSPHTSHTNNTAMFCIEIGVLLLVMAWQVLRLLYTATHAVLVAVSKRRQASEAVESS